MSEKLLVKGTPPPRLDREFTVVGKPLHRRESYEKVTGNAKYAGDIKLPGMLHAKILRSPHAHARILRIDAGKAEAMPGVKAILTKDNNPEWFTYWYMIKQKAFPEIVTYQGEEVAAVAAEDIETAQRALELIDVEYEVLPFVIDPKEAMKDDAPLMDTVDGDGIGALFPPHGTREKNIYGGAPKVLKRGDVEKGFREADLVIEGEYSVPPQHHGTIQTRTCVAQWDGQKLTVWESCQGVWQPKEQLARSLGLHPDQVRVIVRFQGGGFGSKAGAQRFSHYASKLSMVTGRPVRLELTRAEEFVSHPRRHVGTFYIKTGVKMDGTLTAMSGTAIINLGSGGWWVGIAILEPFYVYKCPNAYFEQYGVYTHTQYTGPMRSPQNVFGAFAAESHMDRVAAELKMDPYEFRLKNYTEYGDQDNKIPYSRKSLDKCMELVTQAIGWERWSKLGKVNEGSTRKKGIGMANYIYHGVGTHPFHAEAEIVIKSDGSITLHAGIVDIGTGSATIMSMIAAEELGVSLGDVNIIYGDTKSTRYAPASHAARVTPEMSPAVLQAAAEARQNLFARAAQLLDARVEDLRSKNGVIYAKTDPSRTISFSDACRVLAPGEIIVGRGSRAPNPDKPIFATFGSQAAEVKVDIETGEVQVIKIASAHEFGRALNPKFCIQQHHGGVVMGVAYALFEEGVHDRKTGVLLNANLEQYRMASALDLPEIITFNVEAEDPYFAYSAKGGGEGTNTPTAAAIRNAVCHALGVWIDELPLTPDKILNALAKKRSD